eukprot:GHVL01036429.1.p1 GENE.GHVL01036429.1~~GHVL01036429.1.p1  ORF type:complete len:166 (+),score=14.84 GHVL01036429.1:46-543(+)
MKILIVIFFLVGLCSADILSEDIKIFDNADCYGAPMGYMSRTPFNAIFNMWIKRNVCTVDVCFNAGANRLIKDELIKAAGHYIQFPPNVQSVRAHLHATCLSEKPVISLSLADAGVQAGSCVQLPISAPLISNFRGKIEMDDVVIDGVIDCSLRQLYTSSAGEVY